MLGFRFVHSYYSCSKAGLRHFSGNCCLDHIAIHHSCLTTAPRAKVFAVCSAAYSPEYPTALLTPIPHLSVSSSSLGKAILVETRHPRNVRYRCGSEAITVTMDFQVIDTTNESIAVPLSFLRPFPIRHTEKLVTIMLLSMVFPAYSRRRLVHLGSA